MKDQYIRDLNQAHERLMNIFNQIPAGSEIYGAWGKHEVMAHIVGWYQEGVDALPKILAGEKPESFRKTINGFNEINVKKYKDLSLNELTDRMENLHRQFIKQITDLKEEELTNFYGTKLGKQPINLLWMINEAISHDNGHAQELEEKFPR